MQQTLDICQSELVATNWKTGNVSAALFPKHEGSGLSVKVTNDTGGILFNYHYNITLELMNGAGKIDINKNLSKYPFLISQSKAFGYLSYECMLCTSVRDLVWALGLTATKISLVPQAPSILGLHLR